MRRRAPLEVPLTWEFPSRRRRPMPHLQASRSQSSPAEIKSRRRSPMWKSRLRQHLHCKRRYNNNKTKSRRAKVQGSNNDQPPWMNPRKPPSKTLPRSRYQRSRLGRVMSKRRQTWSGRASKHSSLVTIRRRSVSSRHQMTPRTGFITHKSGPGSFEPIRRS
jgi:hypothetical protein